MTKANLLVIQGIDQGARFEAGDEPLSIGRSVRNEIRIVDTEVSRQHATIQRAGNGFSITDRNSSNGTFVNGVAVRTRMLVNGDRIQIGRSIFLFSTNADEEESKSAARMIDLFHATSEDDRSQIVGRVERDIEAPLIAHEGLVSTPALAQSVANLQALYRISEEAVSPSISQEQLLQRILDQTISVVAADRGCVLLLDPDSGNLSPRVISPRPKEGDFTQRMPVSRSIVDYVMHEGEGVRTSDALRDRRFDPGQSIVQAGIREAMCVPMQGRYSLTGAIYVDTTLSPEQAANDGGKTKFTDEQLRLLVAIGRQAALAIENNRYQDALLKAERLATMGQTIAMLSHHIKNILQGVRGGSYLIDMGLKDHNEDFVRRGWGIVEKNQGKIYNLVMDMLTFSKERKPIVAPADLNQLVTDVVELMQSRAAECGVRLECELDEMVPEVTFDSEGIHRAVLNIMTNAIDAADSSDGGGGAVLVETGYVPNSDLVYVSITDNGPGIPPEQLPKIFNLFESTKGARGTGLGLAVSQKIVREHGGEISVESTVGKGSRFTLSWPRIDEEHRPVESRTLS